MGKIKRVFLVLMFGLVFFIAANSSFANKVENFITDNGSNISDNVENLNSDNENIGGCNGICAGCTLCFQNN